jgi:hypothetical protein
MRQYYNDTNNGPVQIPFADRIFPRPSSDNSAGPSLLEDNTIDRDFGQPGAEAGNVKLLRCIINQLEGPGRLGSAIYRPRAHRKIDSGSIQPGRCRTLTGPDQTGVPVILYPAGQLELTRSKRSHNSLQQRFNQKRRILP